MGDETKTLNGIDGDGDGERHEEGDVGECEKSLNGDASVDHDSMDHLLIGTSESFERDSKNKAGTSPDDNLPPPEFSYPSPTSKLHPSLSGKPPTDQAVDALTKRQISKVQMNDKVISKFVDEKQSYKMKDIPTGKSKRLSSVSIGSTNSSVMTKSSIANEAKKRQKSKMQTNDKVVGSFEGDKQSYKMKDIPPGKSKRLSSVSLGSTNSSIVTRSSIVDGKRNSIKSRTSVISSDIPTHRMRSRMNRRRNRRDYDSDDDEDEDDDDFNSNSFVDDDDDNRTRRSNGDSTRATINSDLYNSVGAVAVYSSGVLVSQRPAVLTQPTEQELQMHEEEIESQNDMTIDAEVYTAKDDETTRSPDGSIPLGDDDSPYRSEAFVDAESEHIVLPTTSVGASSELGLGKRKSSEIMSYHETDEEKPVNLPWYWSPVFWIIVAVLIVALGVIAALVLVRRGKETDVTSPPSISSPPPTMIPTIAPTVTPTAPLDPIKVEAFERHILTEGGISSNELWRDQPTPQREAYLWLMTMDEVTKFNEIMSKEEVERMKTRYILAVFYFTLQGHKWYTHNLWLNSKQDHCKWKFVECTETGKDNKFYLASFRPIKGLKIENNNLSGSLPNELVHLSNLEYLYLRNNNISNFVTSDIGFDSLRFVDLRDNPLRNHGDLFRLTNLENLFLSNTGFSGSLPVEIQRLSNMRRLILSDNKLSGILTNRFQMMGHLESLWIDRNQFESPLDEILDCGNCTETLKSFRSRQNPLIGTIPEMLFNFSMLSELFLTKTQLDGTIPSGFGQLTALESLDLSDNNNFSETNVLPSEIGRLTNLKRLLLQGSKVAGTVPEEFSNLSSLEYVTIAFTSQTGSIPNGICDIDSLKEIRHSTEVDCSCSRNICTTLV